MHGLRVGCFGMFMAAGLIVLGCNPESGGGTQQPALSSSEATTTVNQRVDVLFRGLADSTSQLDTSASSNVATGGIDQVLGSSPSCTPGATVQSGTGDTGPAASNDPTQSTSKALDDFLNRIVQEAEDDVFRQEFVESEDGSQVVYKIDPATACGANADCVTKLTQNPVRFVVTANADDSLNVSLLVGADRINPGTAVLGPSKVSAQVDLAKAMDALELYADQQALANFPERLTGVVKVSVEKHTQGDFVVSGSLLQAFDLLVGQAKGKPVEVKAQPTDPSMQLTVDPASKTLGYAVNYGAIDVSVAGAAVCNDKCGTQEQTGTFTGHLGGYTGALSLTQGAQELTFTGLGLGNDTSSVSLNGSPLGTLALNADQGR